MAAFKSKLHQMTVQFPTDYWNDSCSGGTHLCDQSRRRWCHIESHNRS